MGQIKTDVYFFEGVQRPHHQPRSYKQLDRQGDFDDHQAGAQLAMPEVGSVGRIGSAYIYRGNSPKQARHSHFSDASRDFARVTIWKQSI